MPVTEQFVREHREILKRHACFLEIGEFLGSGAWGSVFASSDPRWVIKITKDRGEVEAAEHVMARRGKGFLAVLFPGLVDILNVRKVEGLRDDGEDLYVLVREDVVPAQDSDLGQQLINDLDNNLYIIEERQAYAPTDLREAEEALRELAPHLWASIRDLICDGKNPIDLGIENIGLTKRPRLGVPEGTLVMCDVSFE
jgi:hypothetical protein